MSEIVSKIISVCIGIVSLALTAFFVGILSRIVSIAFNTGFGLF